MQRRAQSAPLSTWARPHFLELLVANGVTLAEDCTRPRTKRILRLLAADLALEAETYRAIAGRYKAACLVPDHRKSTITLLPANELPATPVGAASAEPAAV